MKAALSLMVFIATWAIGCGHKGDGGGGDGPAPGNGGTVQPEVKDVSGTFVIGNAAQPAKGYELWIYDLTAPSIIRNPLDDQGKFSLALSQFTLGHTYSFHLVQNFLLIGDIDFSDATPGIQAAFTYQGGYGFDLGEIIVPLNKHGEVILGSGSLIGKVGGGFGLATTVDATFDKYPLPKFVTSVKFGSQLYVMDAETLLYSFYNRGQNPAPFAEDLRRLSRFGLSAVEAAPDGVTRARVSQAGDWLVGARQSSADDVPPEGAGLWSIGADEIPRIDKLNYGISIYSDGLPVENSLAIVSLRPGDGGPEAAIPLRVPRILSFPPKLAAVSGSGGAAGAVDYSSTASSNGLTRPFCQSDEVVLDLAPPLDLQGAPVPATILNVIDVYFDYYTAAAGTTTHLTVTPDLLPAPYNAVLVDTALPGLQRSWDPAGLHLNIALSAPVVASPVPEIRLWSALFPPTIGGKSVTKVRLKVYYNSTKEGTSGAIVVWFRKDC